nr:Rrf2 family transcriptional regulator [Victivallis sp. Marseille-Q1083]
MIKISTRFSVGVHILALLVVCKDYQCTSEFIAGSVNTNPVVIRRLIGRLKKAGLVRVSAGVAGAALAKKPEEITLLDIYRAVGAADSTLFDIHGDTNLHCPVGAHIQSALDGSIRDAQNAMELELASQTLADIVRNIEAECR